MDETDTVIKIVSTLCLDNDNVADVGHDTIIPKGVIIDIKPLRKQWWK